MKELLKEGKYALFILDKNNYVVYDTTKSRPDGSHNTNYYQYYSQMRFALRELARRTANEGGSDIGEWCSVLRDTLKRLTTLCGEEV